MRTIVRKFVRICSDNLPIQEPVLEFGSLRVPKQEILADLRPLFKNKLYIGCDIRKGLGVDKIMDVCDTGLPSNSIGTILVLDTFEHVKYLWKGIEECIRILKPNGVLIISFPFYYPIHNYPNDYWRVTPEGLGVLLEGLESSYVDFKVPKNKKNSFPRCVVGVGIKGKFPTGFDKFKLKLKGWKHS